MANGVATDPRKIYFTPAELGNNWVQYIASIGKGGGMRWGTRKLNEKLLPLRAGKIAVLLSLPGAGKTSLAVMLAREYAHELLYHNEQNDGKGGAVCYITVDQSVDEIYTMVLASKEHTVTDFLEGKVAAEEARKLTFGSVELPFYIFGKSVVERRPDQPRLTFPNIEKAVLGMKQHVHLDPALIVVDYIQNMPVEHDKKRMEQVAEGVIRARELCLNFACPLLLCAQAARASREREIKIPLPQDSQWASVIEQEADAMLALWKPYLTELDKTSITLFGKEYPNSDDLLIAGLIKQRGKPAGATFALRFDAGALEIEDWE